MSLLVHSPDSLERKHEFITDLPTIAPVGVPEMWRAPMPPSPSSPPDPQLMLRSKKPECRKPIVCPSSCVFTCSTTSADFAEALDRSLAFAGPANDCPVLAGAFAGARWGAPTIPRGALRHPAA